MGGLYNPPTPASIGAVPTTRNLTAGTNMTGGGDLSADRTFNASGGGGGSSLIYSSIPVVMASIDNGFNACMGNIIYIKEAITVTYLYATLSNATIGHSYNAFIATVNTANGAIIATVGATPTFVTTAVGRQSIKFTFAAPVTIPAGAYLLGIVKNNQANNSPCNMLYGTSSIVYSNLIYDIGNMIGTFGTMVVANTYVTNASSPTAVAASGSSGTGMYAIGVGFTY